MEKEMIMIGVGARPEGEPMAQELGMAETFLSHLKGFLRWSSLLCVF